MAGRPPQHRPNSGSAPPAPPAHGRDGNYGGGSNGSRFPAAASPAPRPFASSPPPRPAGQDRSSGGGGGGASRKRPPPPGDERRREGASSAAAAAAADPAAAAPREDGARRRVGEEGPRVRAEGRREEEGGGGGGRSAGLEPPGKKPRPTGRGGGPPGKPPPRPPPPRAAASRPRLPWRDSYPPWGWIGCTPFGACCVACGGGGGGARLSATEPAVQGHFARAHSLPVSQADAQRIAAGAAAAVRELLRRLLEAPAGPGGGGHGIRSYIAATEDGWACGSCDRSFATSVALRVHCDATSNSNFGANGGGAGGGAHRCCLSENGRREKRHRTTCGRYLSETEVAKLESQARANGGGAAGRGAPAPASLPPRQQTQPEPQRRPGSGSPGAGAAASMKPPPPKPPPPPPSRSLEDVFRCTPFGLICRLCPGNPRRISVAAEGKAKRDSRIEAVRWHAGRHGCRPPRSVVRRYVDAQSAIQSREALRGRLAAHVTGERLGYRCAACGLSTADAAQYCQRVRHKGPAAAAADGVACDLRPEAAVRDLYYQTAFGALVPDDEMEHLTRSFRATTFQGSVPASGGGEGRLPLLLPSHFVHCPGIDDVTEIAPDGRGRLLRGEPLALDDVTESQAAALLGSLREDFDRHGFYRGALYRKLHPGCFVIDPSSDGGDGGLPAVLHVKLPDGAATQVMVELASYNAEMTAALADFGSTLESMALRLGESRQFRAAAAMGGCDNGGGVGRSYAVGLSEPRTGPLLRQLLTNQGLKEKLTGLCKLVGRHMRISCRGIYRDIRAHCGGGELLGGPHGPGTAAVLTTPSFAGSARTNPSDLSRSWGLWAAAEGGGDGAGAEKSRYFVLPDVSVDGSRGVAIRLAHGTVVSWDGRAVRHCTSVAADEKGSGSFYGCVFAASRRDAGDGGGGSSSSAKEAGAEESV